MRFETAENQAPSLTPRTPPGAAVISYTQAMRDARQPPQIEDVEVVEADKAVAVTAGANYVTEQTAPPVEVGSIRGAFAGALNAIIAGAGTAISVMMAGGSNRAAILSGLALALTMLSTTISQFAGFAYADQASRSRKV